MEFIDSKSLYVDSNKGRVRVGSISNIVSGLNCSILGGNNNTIYENSKNSAILGGENNTLSADNTFIIGSNISANLSNTLYSDNINVKGDITISGNTRINKNLTVWGNLSATGTATFADTVFSTTTALSVFHVGSGPAIWVGNSGIGDIASFYDIDANVEILHVGGNNGTSPNVGVKTSSPNKDFTVIGEISATSHITTSGKLYGEGSSITNAVVTGKTIYVDANAGTDTRGTLSKYSAGSPFATIAAAASASVTGDLVYVRAGTYAITSQINLNGEGNMFFETGATVQVDSGVVAFSFSQTALPINAISIRGNADFQLGGTTAGVLTMPSGNVATAVQFECNSISGPNSVTGTLFNCAIGVLSVDAKLIQMTSNFAASNATVFNITGSGVVTARVPFVYCGVFLNGAGAANPGGLAPARFNCDVWTLATFNTTAGINLNLITTNFRIVNYNHIGVGAALSWTENTTIESHTFRGFTWGSALPSGQPHITFASSAGSTTSKVMKLDETNTMRYASTNSLSSNVPINVSTHSTFAGVLATANITFKLGSFTVDPEVNNF